MRVEHFGGRFFPKLVTMQVVVQISMDFLISCRVAWLFAMDLLICENLAIRRGSLVGWYHALDDMVMESRQRLATFGNSHEAGMS